ncbi:uncharacterized protein FOMMEDRAFT_120845 [Fomitiporia mediterranea MF3/22]|uniref:uncharacterized protein n=1 Tax=Fomitiporia mediterranea (strain MF3/22) TaxID=694068 RepID=UPI00044084FB|nr:uncharacterized protein FOMMEDRAFT_120845 [Fomitiporia mediterranea MF3/22]EJD03687.1 hypothetical protein FOMMEDRAFT_120845 [Fomitiporia mediterranea MF3/22]
MSNTAQGPPIQGSSNGVHVKHQDGSSADDASASIKQEKDERKPKPLNRVPRACNACRKQKMRCEGADQPPCRRCRHAGLECLFEKPSREPTLTGEAGLERIKAIEASVSDLRQTQIAIHSTLADLVQQLRAGSIPPVPQTNFNAPFRSSPSAYTGGSPSLSTPTASTMEVDIKPAIHHNAVASESSATSTYQTPNTLPPMISPTQSRQAQRPNAPLPYRSPSSGSGPTQRPPGDMHPPQLPPPNGAYTNASGVVYPSGSQGTTLPPISSFQDISGRQVPPSNVSSVRYHSGEGSMTSPRQHALKPTTSLHVATGHRSPKRKAAGSSNVTSSNNSDFEDDDNGELPSKGLLAPWEVLRGLADVAAERAAQESGENSEPGSRQRSPSPDSKRQKPSKRRKTTHRPPRVTFTDVVTKKIISEGEARDLFKIYYAGCSTFLPVFDINYDTYESLHERSPFAFDAICMVAAKVRDGGGPPGEQYLKCLEECQTISCATLFAPVTRQEAVQAMILVSGWSDNGWLSGGHAVRMAAELSMHQAWPKLMKRIEAGKATTSAEDRKLITASRIWFCLYLFEHQMSYGTGRPAILKDDESIWGSRLLLKHPLAIQDDMRLCSTLELMAIRERIHNKLSPDHPLNDQTFEVLREADAEFRNWFATWDSAFSQKYEDAAFYRQSLQIQQLLAELFHNAFALRDIEVPEDVEGMHPYLKQLAQDSLAIAQQALTITISSSSYREGLKYAVHYTHATATFTASFLLRLARIFPDQCDIEHIRGLVQRLIDVLSEIPARRYANTLTLMLKKSKKRKPSRSPTLPRQSSNMTPTNVPPERQHSQGLTTPVSPTFDRNYSQHGSMHSAHIPMSIQPQLNADAANLDQIWRGFEGTANEQLPVWLSDNLGGNSLSQLGLEAFMMPPEYDQRTYATPQIW